jgi:hypothetical protein
MRQSAVTERGDRAQGSRGLGGVAQSSSEGSTVAVYYRGCLDKVETILLGNIKLNRNELVGQDFISVALN